MITNSKIPIIMRARNSSRLLTALLAIGLLLFCGGLKAQAQDEDFVKYEDLDDDYRKLLESAPEIVYEQEGNDPPTEIEVDENSPAAEMMKWKLSSARELSGKWVLSKLELTDEPQPDGVKAKSREEVMADIQGDFPQNATGFALNSDGSIRFRLGDKEFNGTAGIYDQQLVLENENSACANCGNRFALRILSQSSDKLSLGIPMQDADEPYLINLHFAKSTH